MKNILYAIQDSEFEDFLTSMLDSAQYNVCSTALYKEAVINSLKEFKPDILILKDGLPGNISTEELVFQAKGLLRNLQIILLTEPQRTELINQVIKYGIYDILLSPVNVKELIECILNPRTILSVSQILAPGLQGFKKENKEENVNIVVSEDEDSLNYKNSENVKQVHNGFNGQVVNEGKNKALTSEEQKELERVMNEIESEKSDSDISAKKHESEENNIESENIEKPNPETEKIIVEEEEDDKSEYPEEVHESNNAVLEDELQDDVNGFSDTEEQKEKSTPEGKGYENINIPVDVSPKNNKHKEKKGFSLFRKKEAKNPYYLEQRVILITAPETGIGKSVLSLNLAAQLAQYAQTLIWDTTKEQKIMDKLSFPETNESIIRINTLRVSVKGNDIARISKLPGNLNYASKVEDFENVLTTAKTDHMYIIIVADKDDLEKYISYCNMVVYVTSQQKYFLNATSDVINRSRVLRRDCSNEIVLVNRYNSAGTRDYVVQQILNAETVFTVPDDYLTILKGDNTFLPETVAYPKCALGTATKQIAGYIAQK